MPIGEIEVLCDAAVQPGVLRDASNHMLRRLLLNFVCYLLRRKIIVRGKRGLLYG